MFTGIVRELGSVRVVRHSRGVTRVVIHAAASAPGLAVGDSVSVNGVCLTVTRTQPADFRADLSAETLRASTAAAWRPGTCVHVERSLRATDPIGGHFVLGHVDGIGVIEAVRDNGAVRQLVVGAPHRLLSLLIPKGSVAVDGVSLTLDAGPFARSFTVTLIPQTLRATTFGTRRPGDRVNLELDVLAKAARGAATASVVAGAGRRRLTLDAILGRGWRR
jgi:riboflavin synthase